MRDSRNAKMTLNLQCVAFDRLFVRRSKLLTLRADKKFLRAVLIFHTRMRH